MPLKSSQLEQITKRKKVQIKKVKPEVKEVTNNFEKSLTVENVKKLNVKQLRALIRYHNLHKSIQGYGKMRKIDLILSLAPHLEEINKMFMDKKIEKTITEVKRSITKKSVIDNYIKPTDKYSYFKKMSKEEQDKLVEEIQDIYDTGHNMELKLNKDKVVVHKMVERATKGVRTKKVGGAMKASNLQKFIEATYKSTPDEIEGYKLDKTLSNKFTKVYWNDELKKGVVSEKPTDTMEDVATDVYSAIFGKYLNKHPRFKKSWGVYDKIKKKYGSLSNWVASGYSLGAIVLEHYPSVNEFSEVFLISKPVLPYDIYKGIKPLKNATEIRSKLDATSILKPLQNKADREEIVNNDTLNPLKEHQQKNVFKKIDPEKELGDPNVKTGVGRKTKLLKGMKVRELKMFAKKLGKARKQRVLVGGKRKCELKNMVCELMAD
jgi:hypothetical protein